MWLNRMQCFIRSHITIVPELSNVQALLRNPWLSGCLVRMIACYSLKTVYYRSDVDTKLVQREAVSFYRGMCIVRLLLLVACVCGCLPTSVNAGMLTNSQNQIGATVAGSPGKLVRLATFSFPGQGTDVFVEMRLRLWIEQSSASSPPQLLFAQAGSNPLDLFSGPSVPLQNIGTSSIPGNFVYEYLSPWISMSSVASMRLSSMIASNSGGNVDAYLYSPTSMDFSVPQSSTTWVGNPRSGLSKVTTFYTTTLSLTTVPEPVTAIAFGLGAVALGLVRKRLGRRTRS